jgi:protein-S-isoprenylcysteine O-methyltransferase Ste14
MNARSTIANLALAGWLAADLVRLLVFTRSAQLDLVHSVVDTVEIAVLAGAICVVLLRPKAVNQDARLSSVLVAFGATLLPAVFGFLQPAPSPSRISLVVQASALLVIAASLLVLRRNFSILPQYRSIVMGGPYRLVRHPIYASYLVFDGALAADTGSVLAVVLWLAEATLLLMRSDREERLLSDCDPAYGRYLVAVRWRFLPGLV